MRRPIVSRRPALILLLALSFSSCQTTPPTGPPREPPAKLSAAGERYKKAVEDRLGSFWYRLATSDMHSLALGTVDTTFEIPAAGGRVRNVKVTSNTGGRFAEMIALKAIEQLRAPPVPPEILAQLGQDYMVFEESFTIFQRNSARPILGPRTQ